MSKVPNTLSAICVYQRPKKTMPNYQFLQITTTNRVATLTLNRPPVNSLSEAVLSELNMAVDEVLADANVKVILLTGAGTRAFVAGADITTFRKQLEGGEAGAAAALEFLQLGQTLFSKIEDAPKPFIAALNGVALGGGGELALACHLRLMVDTARIGWPEISLGLIPGWGGTQRLPRLIGPAKALEMILTGEPVGAAEALALGIVNGITSAEALLPTAQALAEKIASKGGLAIRAALSAVVGGSGRPMAAGLAQEIYAVRPLLLSADMREGVTAFLEKRAPKFTDS